MKFKDIKSEEKGIKVFGKGLSTEQWLEVGNMILWTAQFDVKSHTGKVVSYTDRTVTLQFPLGYAIGYTETIPLYAVEVWEVIEEL